MDSLERVSRIDHSPFSGEYYFSSLLEQAYLTEVFTTPQIEAVQMDCFSVLVRQAQLHNGMESSSIRVEDTEGVLESVLFTIGVGLKECGNVKGAALALINEGAEALLVRGGKKMNRMLKTTRLFHAGLVRRLMETLNMFYHLIAEDGINGFFQAHRSQFGVQQTHIMADCPLLHPVTDLAGIEFIQEYAERADCENQFCIRFPPVAIHALLRGLPMDYRELPLDLCGPVLTAAFGCVLRKKSFYPLRPSARDSADLKEKLNGRGRSELLSLLQAAFEKISFALSLCQHMAEYLAAAPPSTSAEIENAVRADTLNGVLLIARLLQGGYRPI